MARPPDPPDPILDAWRRLVAARDPVQACHWFVSRELATRVLPAFPEPGADYALYARDLTPPLVQQALTKLAGLYPDDAPRGVTALIRARKVPAFQVCLEAIEQVAAEYAFDHLAHPEDRLAERARRLYIGLEKSSLPSWQGKPADRVGETGDYALLFHYENWMTAISTVFPEREWVERVPDRSTWRWHKLQDARAAGQLPWAVPPEVLDAAGKAPTREAAALLIVSGTVPLAQSVSPVALARRLTRARRRLAGRLDTAPRPLSPPA